MLKIKLIRLLLRIQYIYFHRKNQKTNRPAQPSDFKPMSRLSHYVAITAMIKKKVKLQEILQSFRDHFRSAEV